MAWRVTAWWRRNAQVKERRTHTETQRMLVWVLLDGGESVFLRIRFYVTRSVWVKWKYQEKIVSKMKNMKVRTNIN